MRKTLAIGTIAIAIWTGLEVYRHGVGGAFGGLLTRLPGAPALETPADRSTPDRAADAYQRAYNRSGDRVDRVLARDPQP